MKKLHPLALSLTVAGVVWCLWLASQGITQAWDNVTGHWPITVTMIFGSLIAGATSEGGGAVAFPVFTKLLHIAPQDAKVFSLAIQSVGMSAATFCIVVRGVPVDWRAIRYASLGGAAGILLSLTALAPYAPPAVVRIFFTAMQVSFAITLIYLNRHTPNRADTADLNFRGAPLILVATGFLGGLASGLVGNGIDIVTFSVLVLLFRVCEKVATPTSVVLMAVNAVVGFAASVMLGTFTPTVSAYWLAAIPVVVLGAPAGTVICSMMRRETIVWILISLIGIEFGTSLWLIPLTAEVSWTAAISMATFGLIYAVICRLGTLRAARVAASY